MGASKTLAPLHSGMHMYINKNSLMRSFPYGYTYISKCGVIGGNMGSGWYWKSTDLCVFDLFSSA